nr:uncharacterized protein LOC107374019 isoform X3 [Nothobranchius furzeri]
MVKDFTKPAAYTEKSVSDDALLRQVIRTTGEESERRRRLGRNPRAKYAYAQRGQVTSGKLGDSKEDPHSRNASAEGLGAVLYQRQDGNLKVIAYGSKTLSPAEKRYHMHSGKLEFLALKWAAVL